MTRNTTPTRPTARTPTQSYKPTSGICATVQWNGLIASSGPPISRPLASQSSIITSAATPAEPARPSSGASANASPPKNIAMTPTQTANPSELPSGIWSPSDAVPKAFELTLSMTAMTSTASHTRTRWAASFSSAIRRLPNGDVATMSRLPRAASPASVPDSARIDQNAVPRLNMAPYFQVT